MMSSKDTIIRITVSGVGSYIKNLTRNLILYFDFDYFKNWIFTGRVCYICGEPKVVLDSKEHIIPDWILRKYNLHNRKIFLANSTEYTYSKYVLPCCEKCNKLMGNVLEEPVSALIEKGSTTLNDFVIDNGPLLIFTWLANIFIKNHLKGANLPNERDRRKMDSRTISDVYYDLHDLHHIHSIARSFYVDSNIDVRVFGSLFFAHAFEGETIEKYYYMDNHKASSLVIRLSDVVIFCNFCDSCAVISRMMDSYISKVGPNLIPIQIAEIFAHFAYNSLMLKNPPSFYSTWGRGQHEIKCKRDSRAIFDENRKVLSDLLITSYSPFSSGMTIDDRENMGEIQYVFDETGEYVDRSSYLSDD